MRLSIIFELLLIFLLIAFAAYGRVIDSDGRAVLKKLSTAPLVASAPAISLKQATENVNKYCVCNENICNCCRDFHIPLVQLSGPGCASLQYLQENKLAMQLSIGDNILSSNIVNGNNPKPVCVTLPGGFSKFCGKIYSIKKEADKHFKACLGLELRSASELEASLRVSCFRFGPDGLKLRPAEPLPATLSAPSSNTDDDYGDLFSLDDDDEDDDDDDDEETENDDSKVSAQTPSSSLTAAAAEQEQTQEQGVEEEDDDDEDDDLLGLSALLDIFTGDDDSTTNKKTKPTSTTALPSFTIPIIALTTTSNPLIESHSNVKPTTTAVSNKGPTTNVPTLRPHSTTASVSNDHDSLQISTEKIVETTSDATVSNDENVNADIMKISHEDETTISTSIENTESINVSLDTEKVTNSKKSKINATETKQSDKKKTGNVAKPANTIKLNKLGTKQQVVSSTTVVNDSSESTYDDENDENDDDDEEDEAVSDENDSDEKEIESANESDKTANAEDAGTTGNDYDQSYEESDEDDDDDENEDVEVMSTLLEDEVSTEKTDRRKNKIKTSKVKSKKEPAAPTRSDYDYELTEILGRKYSNRANTKGVKRKNTLNNRQNRK